MMKSIIPLFIFSLISQMGFSYDTPQSWLYYHDPVVVKPKEPEKAKQVEQSKPQMTAKEVLKKIGEDYEEKFAVAVINPTRENILAEMIAKKKFMDMSEQFADRYQQVIWQTPEMDYTLENPMRTDTLWANGSEGWENRKAKFKEISKKYGLLYVFRSDCPYCKRFSPILKDFANLHGFTVISVTLDGQGTKEFPNPMRDITALKRRNALPEVVPALYLVDPQEPEAKVLGFGLMNSTDLEQRIAENVGLNLQQGVVSKSHIDELMK